MQSKKIITICMFIGGMAGGYIPLLWGADYFSFSSIIFNALGAIIGIWVGFRISN